MHFDNFIFILLGLAFVLLRWLAQRAADSKRKPPRQEPERPTRAPVESDEERVRRFMEALGNPVGSKPPSKVTPRPPQSPGAPTAETMNRDLERQTKPARKMIWTAPLPPLTTTPPPEPASQQMTLPQLPAVPRTERKITRAALPTLIEPARRPETARSQIDIAALLRSPDSVRSAIVLREVLGPARAFQPLES